MNSDLFKTLLDHNVTRKCRIPDIRAVEKAATALFELVRWRLRRCMRSLPALWPASKFSASAHRRVSGSVAAHISHTRPNSALVHVCRLCCSAADKREARSGHQRGQPACFGLCAAAADGQQSECNSIARLCVAMRAQVLLVCCGHLTTSVSE